MSVAVDLIYEAHFQLRRSIAVPKDELLEEALAETVRIYELKEADADEWVRLPSTNINGGLRYAIRNLEASPGADYLTA